MDARTKRLIEQWLGLTLNGWKIEEFINSGKSALVFRGSKDSVPAAIKIFDPEIIEKFGEDDERERINRELELVGVHHEHLIRIFDGGYSDEHKLFFVVMEFIEAPNLATVISNVPLEFVPKLISQLASAAHFLHDRKILHRDIKPDNVVISADFQKLTLLDLGVIRPYEPAADAPLTDREKKLFVGTLQYSSPEYLLRQEQPGQDGALALTYYQLGAVLHDLLMKKRIFAEETDPFGRLVRAVLYETPVIDTDGRPPHLVTLARNCLVKKPDLRLRLVSWNDFDQQANTDMVAVAKERIRKRKVQASYEQSSDDAEDTFDVQHHRSALLSSLLPRLAEGIRQECTAGQLPPRTVEEEPDPQTSIGVVNVQFKAAPRFGLLRTIHLRFSLEILDHEAQVVSLSFSVSATGSPTNESEVKHPAKVLFTGVYDDAALRDATAKVLYPVVADAMETNSDPPNANDDDESLG